MVRLLGPLAGIGFVAVALWSLMWGVIAYVSEPHVMTAEHYVQKQFPLKEASFSFSGPMGNNTPHKRPKRYRNKTNTSQGAEQTNHFYTSLFSWCQLWPAMAQPGRCCVFFFFVVLA